MTKDHREHREGPDPEALLDTVGRDDRRGLLTVFLGAAAGVGKTYAMLQGAHEQLAKGVDFVVAWAETHGRAETEALLQGLPSVPPRRVAYRGTTLFEPDYQAVLARRPTVVAVDELAHTNAPGSIHARRYQDVADLLDAGIDVWTTLNVQHLESLNDVVSSVTGVTVRETVPDSFLDGAEVKLVDIPVEELIARLGEGKVYAPGLAGPALERFFRPGNLNALRELALRFTAERVDESLSRYMRAHAITGPWPVASRLMVCVGPSPFSAQVLRVGARMAKGLQAYWLALHVESPGWAPLSAAARERLAKNLRLAEELGAEVAVVTAADAAAEIVNQAKTRNISSIVIGQPLRRRPFEFFRGTMVDRVIRLGQGLSVHIIPGPDQGQGPADRRPVARRAGDAAFGPDERVVTGRDAIEAILLVGVVTAALAAFVIPDRGRLDLANLALLLLLPVLIAAARYRPATSVLAAILATLAFDFLFVPPYYTFTVASLGHVVVLGVFLAVGVLVSTLAGRQRRQTRLAETRENRTAALYALAREMAAVDDMEQFLVVAARRAAEAAGGWACFLVPDAAGSLEARAWQAAPGATPAPSAAAFPEKERVVAQWAFDHDEAAGAGTATLAGATGLYLPASSEGRPVAVLGVELPEVGRYLSPERRGFLDAFAALGATAITRARLAEEAYEARLARDSERLERVLLDAVSHEMRTPLAAITGSVTSLLDDPKVFGPEESKELLRTVKREANRMNNLVGNLLDMARLDSGTLRLNRREWDIREVVQAAIGDREDVLAERSVEVDVPEGLPAVAVDFSLIETVIGNLLDNAAKFSGGKGEIVVGARQTAGGEASIEVWVTDSGPGIPPGELESVFGRAGRAERAKRADPDRGRGAGARGSGLGLSICRGIVQAHGGRIWAEAHPGGGTTVRFTLPLGKAGGDERARG